MTNLSWQEALAHKSDAATKEWMALERRYHLKQRNEDSATHEKHISLFLSLSDPELPTRFRGQVELEMTLPKLYPMEAAGIDFTQWNSRLSYEQVQVLSSAVNARALELCGSFAMRKLLTWIDNNFWPVIAPFETGTEATKELEAGRTLQSHPTVIEAIKASPSSVQTKRTRRRGPPPCHFFKRGKCRDENSCKFLHTTEGKPKTRSGGNALDVDCCEADQAQPIKEVRPVAVSVLTTKDKKKQRCKFNALDNCRSADKCKFAHERKGSGTNNVSQLQILNVSPSDQVDGGIATMKLNTDVTIRSASVKSDHRTCSSGMHKENINEWSEAQQRALDMALKKYPAAMDKAERWSNIAKEIQGKSLNECIDRFKFLCKIIQRRVGPIAAAISRIEISCEVMEADPIEIEENAKKNSEITPCEQRVMIEADPKIKGTQIRLENLFLHQVGTLVAHRLVCQVQCAHCPLKFDALLTLTIPEVQKWCPRCSVLHHVLMRPVFAHTQSDVLAYIDTGNCFIIDVLPSDVLATCLECGCEALLKKVAPAQRSEQACYNCHVKLAVMFKRFVAGKMEGSRAKCRHLSDNTAVKSVKSLKNGVKPVIETFVLGQPLPQNGACNHYKHSLRWFRFQCCGKALPCDVCHDSSDCLEANLGKFASRMICGLCSKEQSSSIKMCSCGNDVSSKKNTSRFWEGGIGE
ncbi:uncharacterized protein CCR75_006635 [Bremia lactucae]|uniref:Uncharacterized protein n=1 Tax=Bremia lactucae TaxID=4779 RepID=A0A976FDD2_BRELC|nr:hypothetical protein CCR75_006635 [Bremia lactucae]